MPLARVAPHVHEAIVELVESAMEHDLERRLPDAATFVARLDALLSGSPARQRSKRSAVAVAIVLAVGGASMWALARGGWIAADLESTARPVVTASTSLALSIASTTKDAAADEASTPVKRKPPPSAVAAPRRVAPTTTVSAASASAKSLPDPVESVGVASTF